MSTASMPGTSRIASILPTVLRHPDQRETLAPHCPDQILSGGDVEGPVLHVDEQPIKPESRERLDSLRTIHGDESADGRGSGTNTGPKCNLCHGVPFRSVNAFTLCEPRATPVSGGVSGNGEQCNSYQGE